jgi:phosphate transport system permease protein
MNSAPTSVPGTGVSSASAPSPSVPPPTLPPPESTHDLLHVRRRPVLSRWFERGFEWTCAASTWFGLGVLVVLLIGVLWQGAGWLTWSFLTNYDSRHPENAGVIAGLWGSFWLVSLATLLTVPIGVGAAMFLEEYQTKGWLRTLIEVNLSNLAGVPSIVYGILGMAVFVKMFGAFQRDPQQLELSLGFTSVEIPLPFGRTVLSGAMTLALLMLPVVIVASREALRAIPPSIRHASYALGATHWQTIRHVVLPVAVPGIVTGVILAVARAAGETAPLLMIGAAIFLARTPGGIESPADVFRHPHGLLEAPFDHFTALPIQIYNWVSRPEPEYRHVAAAAILVLLAVLQLFNIAASIARARSRSRARW